MERRAKPLLTSMLSRSEVEISEAIQFFAKKCMENGDPRACAERCAIGLIADGWTGADAREVQVGALLALAHLTGNDNLRPDP
jgi:hypothetical protein